MIDGMGQLALAWKKVLVGGSTQVQHNVRTILCCDCHTQDPIQNILRSSTLCSQDKALPIGQYYQGDPSQHKQNHPTNSSQWVQSTRGLSRDL